jgi:RNA polymerase sigma-70 factor (ECF subfamily)
MDGFSMEMLSAGDSTATNSGRRPSKQVAMPARANNKEALLELVRTRHLLHMRLAAALTRDSDAAQDVVQSAYAKAFLHADQLQDPTKIKSWFNQILANECRQMFREKGRLKLVKIGRTVDGENDPSSLPDPGETPEHMLTYNGFKRLVDAEVGRMPPLLRNVFVLRDLQDLPLEAVAARLCISVPAVKSRLHRARAEMRSRLAKYIGRRGPVSLIA